MRYLLLLGLVLVFNAGARSQEYRLSYDPGTVPELYHTTTVFLEQRAGNGYREVKGKYRLVPHQGTLTRNNRFSWDPDMPGVDGALNFTVNIDNREIPLKLYLPVLKQIRFNMYADSIKPILNYYVNVEGEFSNGKVLPLTTDHVTIASDVGTMNGNEWLAPKERAFDKVVFTAVARSNPSLKQSTTVYLKRSADPRDAEGYEEPGTAPDRSTR